MVSCPICAGPMREGADKCDYARSRHPPASPPPPLPPGSGLDFGTWIEGLDGAEETVEGREPRAEQRPMPAPCAAKGFKVCRQCGQEKELRFFPRDRSRRDGRWHSCTLCRKRIWADREKPLALRHKQEQAALQPKRSGIPGLRRYYRKGKGLAGLPPYERFQAQRNLSRSLARAKDEGRQLSQPEIALRIANAISNVRRVGDRHWSRKMRRLKGFKRAERRKLVRLAEQEPAIAAVREARRAAKAPRINWQLRPW
jgi:hypothetical protein